jgi:hypothetical protein
VTLVWVITLHTYIVKLSEVSVSNYISLAVAAPVKEARQSRRPTT